MLWIPEGFAHGFLVLSETAEVLYKTTDFYDPASERCIVWNDPTLNIPWPLDLLDQAPTVSPKDANGSLFLEADLPTRRRYALPIIKALLAQRQPHRPLREQA